MEESPDARLDRISAAVYEAAKAEGATPAEAFAAAQGIYSTVRKAMWVTSP